MNYGAGMRPPVAVLPILGDAGARHPSGVEHGSDASNALATDAHTVTWTRPWSTAIDPVHTCTQEKP